MSDKYSICMKHDTSFLSRITYFTEYCPNVLYRYKVFKILLTKEFNWLFLFRITFFTKYCPTLLHRYNNAFRNLIHEHMKFNRYFRTQFPKCHCSLSVGVFACSRQIASLSRMEIFPTTGPLFLYLKKSGLT